MLQLSMEGSQFFRSLHHSSSDTGSEEESSKEDLSLRSEPDSSGHIGGAALSFHSAPGDLGNPPDQSVPLSPSIDPAPMSPPADPSTTGCWREINYSAQGYEHHQLALQYAACNNFAAAFCEWKLAYYFNHYAAAF